VAERDRGSATAETAVALPAVVVAVSVVLAVGQLVVAQVRCVDAARAAARSLARGEGEPVARSDAQAAGGGSAPTQVEVRRSAGSTDVRAQQWVRVLGGVRVRVSARAVARDETGSAVLLVVAAMALAMLGVLLVAGVGSAVVARHQARSAADLGALAAADVIVGRAGGDPCARAASVVTAVGARVEGCTVTGSTSSVVASVEPAGAAGGLGRATASARAGPAGQASR
jgi:secretion/DNA translocation related TadE-like protein